MKKLLLQSLLILVLSLTAQIAQAKYNQSSTVEAVKRDAETQVKNLVEPVLQKFCHDECKLMSVIANVDLTSPDEISPGFDDVDPKSITALAPSSARLKLLIDEQVGPISRSKLLELIQQYLDTLEFPVKVETQITHFPQPIGSAAKISELRDKISKQFKNTLDDLFRQFCPEHCLFANFELQTERVNPEEAQFGSGEEFIQDNGVALRLKNISGTILMDITLSPDEQKNILEMAKLKTNYLKNVTLSGKAMKFPHPKSTEEELLLTKGKKGQDSTSKEISDLKSNAQNNTSTINTNKDNNVKQEHFERFEKIERVENGDAVQVELQKFKVYGLIFACSILSLLIFLTASNFHPKLSGTGASVHKVIQSLTSDPVSNSAPSSYKGIVDDKNLTHGEKALLFAKRYEIEKLREELMSIFAQQPKVAKYVFSRILTEEGVETTAQYIYLFGENVVIEMLRDPSLQSDMSELMEFYAKNTIELNDDEKLDLLHKLHHRTVSGKLIVMGSRSSNLFDFLAEMDGLQILELVRNESLTVKAIILTQCDTQKRSKIYSQLDETTRMNLLTELSRIDYLPRDYIFNVAHALKRKRRENPKLNTEALPGSDVLLNLLERTGPIAQKSVIKNLEMSNPDSARTIKAKLVCLDTLQYLRDGQLLEVVLSLRHDELLQFLKGAPNEIRGTIFSKSPKDLVIELEDELTHVSALSREAYQAVERKILNRMKIMANEGLINLVETNDRMFGANVNTPPMQEGQNTGEITKIKKVAGW